MCFLFLDPQDAVGPSISSSVVLCSFVLLLYIVVLVLVVCLCPSSVHVVATITGTVLFPLLCSVFLFFALLLLLLLLLLFAFYCQDLSCTVPVYSLITSCISTLVYLWNTE